MVLNEVSAELISKYRKELLEGLTPKSTKRTGSTVNRYMASLSAVFTYGIKECGWIVENPVFRVRKLKESKGRDRILSLEEFERLLHACTQSRNSYLVTILLIAVTTGARRGEILALKRNDIVFDKKLICIKDSKNGRPRSVPIAEEVEVCLQDHFNKHNPPGPLSQYVCSAIKGGCRDDGFLQRFQVIVWPDIKEEWKLVENCQIEQFEEDINQIFDFLDN